MSLPPVYLVDASVYIFRAWFSVPGSLTNSAGEPINAVHGFAGFLGAGHVDTRTGLLGILGDPGERVRQFISVSSATRALPFSIAVRSLQREMICRDPKWNGGNYDPADPPLDGQRLARKLGMV